MTAEISSEVQTNQPSNGQQFLITDGGPASSLSGKKEISESKIDRVLPPGNEADLSADKVIEELKDKYNSIKKIDLNGVVRSNKELTSEEVQKKVSEVGDFSTVLEDILHFMLQKIETIEQNLTKETESRKSELESKSKYLENSFGEQNNKLKQIIKKENEERQRDMKDVEAFVKKENADRKKEVTDVVEKIKSDEEKRLEEARSMEDKMEREKRELEEYLKQDALEHKQKMEKENQAIKEKLDKEAAELKKKMSEADEEKAEEMKFLQDRLNNERKILQDKMERERLELAEEMEKQEQDRKNEAVKLQNKLEEDRKQHENGIVRMFERLKGENENRKAEIHGLKDILVRENDRITQEQATLEATIAEGLSLLDQKLNHELVNCKAEVKKNVMEDLTEVLSNDKKELRRKMESDYSEVKRRLEVEATEIRDKMQFDKKGLMVKFEEMEDEMQKEAKLVRTQLQREREETRESILSEGKIQQGQMDSIATDLMDVLKKERVDRERAVESLKRRLDDEKKELQETVDRDRANLTKKMNEEHDQRRIEQLEVQQRLENTEKSGKSDIAELFSRVKRYEDEARLDNDEVRQAVNRIASSLEERAIRDKKELKEILAFEASDLSRRMDKCNIERLNDSADIEAKICLLGRSASKHLETLKNSLHRNSLSLVEAAGKPGSVVFSAFRDGDHTYSDDNFVTFSGCHLNIGSAFSAKTGLFQCKDPGVYFFMLTVSTYDGRDCHLTIKKNGKTVASLKDSQSAEESSREVREGRGRTMLSQSCVLDLTDGDTVQVAAQANSGISGKMPPQETFKSILKNLSEDEGISISEGFRGFTPARGTTPIRGFTPSHSRGTTPPASGQPLNSDLISAPAPAGETNTNTEEDHRSYSDVAKKSGARSLSSASSPPPPPPPQGGSSKSSSSSSGAPTQNKNGNSFYSFLKR